MEKNTLKNFLKFTPYPSKERLFTYEVTPTPLDGQKILIKNLGASTNKFKTVKTWNDEEPGNLDVYLAKVKLN